MLHFIINKKKVCLDQFGEGLKELGFLDATIIFPMNYEKFFVPYDDDLTPEKVKSVISMPDVEGTPTMLMQFLDECSVQGSF